jgi:hypothetical protein
MDNIHAVQRRLLERVRLHTVLHLSDDPRLSVPVHAARTVLKSSAAPAVASSASGEGTDRHRDESVLSQDQHNSVSQDSFAIDPEVVRVRSIINALQLPALKQAYPAEAAVTVSGGSGSGSGTGVSAAAWSRPLLQHKDMVESGATTVADYVRVALQEARAAMEDYRALGIT